MGVVITFEPGGLTGVIAKKTRLSNAARRMGVQFAFECGGPDECSGCVVTVHKGDSLLSAPTSKEFSVLGSDLLQNRRMACQTYVEHDGELIVEIVKSKNSMNNDATKDVRKVFAELPLTKKLTTLIQLEVATVVDALDEISNRSTSLGEKLLEKLEDRVGKKTRPDHNDSQDPK